MNTSQLNSNHHRLMADCDACKNRSRDHYSTVTGNLVTACASLGAMIFGGYEISVADNGPFRSSAHIAHKLPIAGVTTGFVMGSLCGWAAGTLHESTSKMLSSLSNRRCTCPETPAQARKRQLPSGNSPLPSHKDMKESAGFALPDEVAASDSDICPETSTQARKEQLSAGNSPHPYQQDCNESAGSTLPGEAKAPNSGDNGQERCHDSDKKTTISFVKNQENFRQNFFRALNCSVK